MSNLTQQQAHGLHVGWQNEELYRRLVAISPDAIAVTGLDAVVIACNAQTAELLGYDSPEDLAGKSAFELIAPEDLERAMYNLRQILEAGTVRDIEYALVGKDGARIPVQLSASVVFDEIGVPVQFVATARDMTAWKRAEREIENLNKGLEDRIAERTAQLAAANRELQRQVAERERLEGEVRRQAERVQVEYERMAALVNSANISLALMDAGGCFVVVNDAWLQRGGYEREQVVGHYAEEFATPEAAAGARATLAQALATGEAVVLHDYFVVTGARREGYYADISFQPVRDSEGAVTGFLSVGLDVTDKVLARQEVESQRALLQTIFYSAPVAIAYYDREMRLVDFNSEYARMSPPDVPIAPGQVIYDLNPAARAREEAHRRALAGEAVDEEGVRYEYADGEVRYRDFRYRPVRDADGEVTGIVSSAVDVTARHELVRQKDEFLALASHELKTPITSIKGFAQIASRAAGKLGEEKLSHMLAIISEQSDRLSRLIDDLNDVSRTRGGALKLHEEPFDLCELVRDTLDNLQLTAPDFAFPLVLPGAPAIVNADRQRIEQVITNLVDNAVKYSGTSRVVETTIRPEGDEVVVGVRDYGVGIPASQQAQVFELFFRSSNVETKQYSGLGLGLFISRGIVARHGGRTWFESAEREGSTFFFSLPLGAAL